MSPTTNADDRPLLAIAFSGGLDSTVLLDLVSRLWPPDRLLALHVHHHLQPAADAWPAHCRAFAAARGVRCRVLHAESRPAPGDSVEQWARDERYRLLAAEARAQGAAALLTAHHADDQAETLLLRMRRGTGPRGLAGILPVRHVHGLPVLRPLLDSRRAELAEYARREGLQWVEDPSNDDPRFARNRLRRQGREALPDDEVTRLHAEAERARAEWERIERAAVADVEAAMVGGVPGVPGVSGASGASGGSSVLGGGSVPGGGGTGGESSESSRNGGLVGLCGLGGCDRIGRHLAAAPGGGEAVAGVPPFIGPLDRGVLRSLPRERCVWALREWAGRFGLPPPSRAQTDQLMRQLVDGPASDAEVVVRDVALLRHRDRLFGLRGAAAARRRSAAAAALEPVALRDLPAVEQGSDVTIIELPAGLGRLHVRTDPSDPLSGLRVAGGGQGGWRLRPEAGRPSRTLKNLYQEAGVPAWLRPLYPVVLAGADVVYSAALGHGVPAAGRAHASWSSPILGWEPADDDDLAALLRWHAAAIAAPAAGPAR